MRALIDAGFRTNGITLASSLTGENLPPSATARPELLLLQTQTCPEARARFAPLAVVDGMFLMFDPAGRWPEDIVEATGLELDAEGVLKATEPGHVKAALGKIWDRVIGQVRADVAFVEDAGGPRLEFRRVSMPHTATSSISGRIGRVTPRGCVAPWWRWPTSSGWAGIRSLGPSTPRSRQGRVQANVAMTLLPNAPFADYRRSSISELSLRRSLAAIFQQVLI